MGILKTIGNRLPFIRDFLKIRDLAHTIDFTNKCLLGIQTETFFRELMREEKYQSSKNLCKHEFKTFSQTGEDGVLVEIFRRIGTTNKTFLEIGVGDGLENNTTFWLMQGWQGTWIDGSEPQIHQINARFARFLASGKLQAVQSFVTAENVEELFAKVKAPKELDLFSLDIDRNTYWVWEAINNYRPRVIVVEYNAFYPPTVDFAVPYDGSRVWDGTIDYGASLKTFTSMAEDKGYKLVGCSISGVNAFYVREDLCGDHFQAPYTAEFHFEPYRIAQTLRSHLHLPGI